MRFERCAELAPGSEWQVWARWSHVALLAEPQLGEPVAMG